MARNKKADPAMRADQADTEKIAQALAVVREQAPVLRAQQDMDVFQLGQAVGAIHMSRLQRTFLAAGEIRLFEEISLLCLNGLQLPEQVLDLASRAAGPLAAGADHRGGRPLRHGHATQRASDQATKSGGKRFDFGTVGKLPRTRSLISTFLLRSSS